MLDPFGFRWRRASDVVGLSPEAQARVNRKIADVQRARAHAMAHAHECVVGRANGGVTDQALDDDGYPSVTNPSDEP